VHSEFLISVHVSFVGYFSIFGSKRYRYVLCPSPKHDHYIFHSFQRGLLSSGTGTGISYHWIRGFSTSSIRGISIFLVAVRGIHTAVCHSPRRSYRGLPRSVVHIWAQDLAKKVKSSQEVFFLPTSRVHLFAASYLYYARLYKCKTYTRPNLTPSGLSWHTILWHYPVKNLQVIPFIHSPGSVTARRH
jgi:hypothetical protein